MQPQRPPFPPSNQPAPPPSFSQYGPPPPNNNFYPPPPLPSGPSLPPPPATSSPYAPSPSLPPAPAVGNAYAPSPSLPPPPASGYGQPPPALGPSSFSAPPPVPTPYYGHPPPPVNAASPTQPTSPARFYPTPPPPTFASTNGPVPSPSSSFPPPAFSAAVPPPSYGQPRPPFPPTPTNAYPPPPPGSGYGQPPPAPAGTQPSPYPPSPHAYYPAPPNPTTASPYAQPLPAGVVPPPANAYAPQPYQYSAPAGTPLPPTALPPTPPPPAAQPAPPPPARIDPGQIPSATTVADGKPVRYLTGSGPCPIPPPAATQYVSVDEGNCTPRFARMSMYHLPFSDELREMTHIPLAMIIQPLAEPGPGEDAVPLVDLTSAGGPVRCRRCRAYMNPFNVFVDGGRKFICKLCECENTVPDAYFSPLESTGKRRDLLTRPELSRGSVDIVAGAEFITKPCVAASYLFVIDVSEFSVSSGLLQSIISTLREVFNELAERAANNNNNSNNNGEASDPRIGIVTYDATVHFWNIKPSLAQPQMLVVSDTTNVFVPLAASTFLVPYSRARTQVDALLAKLPELFRGVKAAHASLGPAVQAASMALEEVGGGRAVVFWSGMEPGNAVAKRREELKLIGTDKEKTLLQPRNPAYKALASECAARTASVDLFLCMSSVAQPLDVASLAVLPTHTGGNLYYYSNFQSDRDSDRLFNEVRRAVTRPCAYDVIARVRTSRGLTVVDYVGNFKKTEQHDVEIASIDADGSIVVNLKHDDKLDEKVDSVLQFAMLYTSSKGERLIRVHTISLANSPLIGNVFKQADLDAILAIFAKQAVQEMQHNTLAAVRANLVDKCVEVLSAYRKNCASGTPPGQLILPESLKLLPIYMLSLQKHPLLRPADISPDERGYYACVFFSEPPALITPLVYPRLYALHKLAPAVGIEDTGGRIILPTPTRLTSEYLDDNGFYLLENGKEMWFWLRPSAPATAGDVLRDVIALLAQKPAETQSPDAERVVRIVQAIRAQRCKGAALRVVRSRDQAEIRVTTSLVEDRLGEVSSYVDFLVNVHKMIQNRLA